MTTLYCLKLGGSLITDKTTAETLRTDLLAQAAAEIAAACRQRPALQLVIGHGSGSFGHVAAAAHNTAAGARSADEWQGFAAVSDAAARLNARVRKALLAAGLPAITLQPSASAHCVDGRLIDLNTGPVSAALKAGLVPLVHGDVAFDTVRGGTIISTEAVLSHLARSLRPAWLLLAGDTDGVYDRQGQIIPILSRGELDEQTSSLGPAAGADVTGGMLGKVEAMLALAAAMPELRILIFSGRQPGRIRQALLDPTAVRGTRVKAD